MAMRLPVPTQQISTDYTAAQRSWDRDFRVVAHFDNIPTADDFPVRRVLMRVSYTWNGAEVRTDVPTYVLKGELPPRNPLVWIDPRRPSNGTAVGPGQWGVLLTAIVVIAIPCWWIPI
ncbi:MAG TPA: hypothetical protein VM913_05445 [Sphingomicrobium sp.]|nr:hypothetical protein [Sphingomicrobium sp.]